MGPFDNSKFWILALSALVTLSCAGVETVRRDYQRVMTFPGRDASGDHLLLVTPTATFNALLAMSLAQRPLRATVPVTGIPAPSVVVRRITIAPSAPDRCTNDAVWELSADVQLLNRVFRDVRLRAQVPLIGDVRGDRLIVTIRTTQAQQITVRWPAGWKKLVENELARKMGPMALVLRDQLQMLLTQLEGQLSTQLTGLVRRLPLEAFTRFRLPLPSLVKAGRLPLKQFRLTSCPNGVVMRLTTTLYRTEKRLELPTSEPGSISVLVPGQTIVGVLHWALGHGLIAPRYNRKGDADPEGPLHITFGWGERPGVLLLRVWHLAYPAGVLTLAGRLRVWLDDNGGPNRLKLRISRFRPVKTSGNLMFRIGAWNHEHKWAAALDAIRTLVLPKRFRIGHASVEMTVHAVEMTPAGIVVRWRIANGR
ncbi:MAG: hypothetical protein KC609_00640 [Myxococcales bacterium]|nr:hypothetical protein [Myxococcales bacterium]